MKKLVIATAMSLGLLASSYAQGFFDFDNSANYTGDTSAFGIITIGTLGAAGEGSVGAAVGSGSAPQYSVGYIWLLGTTYSGDSLTPTAFLGDGASYGAQVLSNNVNFPAGNPGMTGFYGDAPTGDVGDGAGLYSAGAVEVAATGLPDLTLITVQIVAWYNPTGTGTFAAAYASGTQNVGWSTLETIKLVAGTDQASQDTTGIPGFTVQPVPEPSTLALAGLGGLSLLLMRRRK